MMTNKMIKEIAPAVFSKTHSSDMSDKYVFVPTFELLDMFQEEGWNVSQVKQSGRNIHSTHEIRMRNGQIPKVGDSFFEAIIRNSHNGSLKFSISSGLFRLVCSNGLAVPTSISESFSVKHTNFNMGDVREVTDNFAKKLPIIKESMEKMMNRELTTKEKIRLTKEAIKLRFNSPEMMTNDTIESILTPNRIEDQGNNLWNVFNTIQEKLIRGGFIYSVNEKRPRTARPINNIINSNKVNTELWELAQSMC
jgi:hypothetical protein